MTATKQPTPTAGAGQNSALESKLARLLMRALPTLDDARQDAAAKREESPAWYVVVDAYDRQIEEAKAAIMEANGWNVWPYGQSKEASK